VLHVVSVTTLASLLTGVNARLAVVGIPTVAQALNADVVSVVWIIQGFMLGSTVTQVIVGRLADLYGRVRLFNVGFLVFSLGALAAGLSTNSVGVVLARVLQGVGGAFLMSLSITILTDNVRRELLATWLGVNQIAWRVGALAGLTLSGFIIDYLSWRWLFLIQVPIGVASYLWSVRFLREVYRPVERPVIDWPGFTLFTSSITLILISLTLLTYGLSITWLGTALLVAGLLLLAAFTVVELRTQNPLIDLSIFKVWQFTGGVVAQVLYSIAFGASITLLSLYLQLVRGLPASATGLALLPFELSFLVSGVVGGRLSDIYGYVPLTIAGPLTASASLYTLSKTTPHVGCDINLMLIAIAFLGIGTGLFTAPNVSSIMSSVPPHRRGIASSIRTLTFNVGFMISLNTAILTITKYLPYDITSKILTHIDMPEAGLGDVANEFARGVGESFKLQTLIMLSAIPFSIARLNLRGRRSRGQSSGRLS